MTESPDVVPRWSHPIKAAAFDLDGLLVNTEELYTEVGTLLLERRGRRFTRDLKRSIMGLPGQQAFELIIDREQLTDSVDDLARESERIFHDLLPNKLQLMPGVLELLAELDRVSMPRCVATSSSLIFAETVLRHVRLNRRFEFVLTPADVAEGKPQPDIYLAAAARMQVDAKNMLVLEDSQHGSKAGISSGACTIAVPGSHSEDQDFSGVHYRADSLLDPAILAIVRG